jgi:hypothetical protein
VGLREVRRAGGGSHRFPRSLQQRLPGAICGRGASLETLEGPPCLADPAKFQFDVDQIVDRTTAPGWSSSKAW